uniref:Uncharacterized protein n=1 Tax=Nelumbo nucifera TaxID=4432 RepID=A0A822ZJP3_NELNU|nr:TPA_asm: hypothetical protein HUJ06_001885 [Nelumbo nucifera]
MVSSTLLVAKCDWLVMVFIYKTLPFSLDLKNCDISLQELKLHSQSINLSTN